MPGRALYIEQRVNGSVTATVRRGDPVEVRVVYESVALEPFKIDLQRTPGGSLVSSGVVQTGGQGGTFYLAFNWVVDYPEGAYTLKAWFTSLLEFAGLINQVTAQQTVVAPLGDAKPLVVQWFADKTQTPAGSLVKFTAAVKNTGGAGTIDGQISFSQPVFVQELGATVSQVSASDHYVEGETKVLTFTVKMPSTQFTAQGGFGAAPLTPITVKVGSTETNPPPGGTGTKTLTIPFWQGEPIAEPPATRETKISLPGDAEISRVDFRVKFEGESGGLLPGVFRTELHVKQILLNGQNILSEPFDVSGCAGSSCPIVEKGFTVMDAAVVNGSNSLTLDYDTGLYLGGSTAKVTASVTVTYSSASGGTGKVTGTPTQQGKLDVKTIAIIAGIGVAAVGAIVLLSGLRKNPIERAVESMVQLELVKSVRGRK